MMKLFGFQQRSSKNIQECPVPNLDGNQPYNPYTQITVYSHHSNIIQHLLFINKTRVASAGDDALIVIWDLQTTERVHVLSGHSRPVTCLSKLVGEDTDNEDLDHTQLLSAASDKLICIWNPNSGSIIKQLFDHQCTARCFLEIPEYGCFCSGGQNLCLWTPGGHLITAVDRQNEEDISQLILLRDGRLVLCVDKRPVVYDICQTDGSTRLLMNRRLTPHREAITCLLKINDACFVSGSLDGTIILWSSQALAPSRYFNSITDYLGDNRMLPYSIQAIICLDQRYLVCAIGTGFCIYDIVHGSSVTNQKHAHYSKILSLALVHNGTLLATASEDGSVRLWGNKKMFTEHVPTINHSSALERLLGLCSSGVKVLRENSEKLDLIGECLGHKGAVKMCLDARQEGFLTCGADGLIINWKDGLYESMKENALLQDLYNSKN